MTGQVIVIDLIIHELALVCWNRVPRKEPCDVLRERVINAGVILY